MNAVSIREAWGKHQIKLKAMAWSDFVTLIETLDELRYPSREK